MSNDPSARFNNIINENKELNSLTKGIVQYFTQLHHGQPHHLFDVIQEYATTSRMLANATDDATRAFCRDGLTELPNEMHFLHGRNDTEQFFNLFS